MPLPKFDKKYSYADYLCQEEGERLEILDGVAYMQAAPSRIHQEISMELATQFHVHLKGSTCKVFAAPFCVRLDDKKNNSDIENVVEPDISIVCDPSKLDDRGCKGAPDMIIEILSPSTAKHDKLLKFNKYEKAGVKEYWIVEPDQKLVSVFLLQPDGRYGRPDIYADEDIVPVSLFKTLAIDLKSVFKL